MDAASKKMPLSLSRLVAGVMWLGWVGMLVCTPGLRASPATFNQERPRPVGVMPGPPVSLTPSVSTAQLAPLYMPTRQPLEPGLIEHGDRTQPVIALTFDACQSPEQVTGYDEAVIDILTGSGTPATLFLGGLWLQHHFRQAQRLAANPLFELGNHSWSHADFTRLDPAEMEAEIERTQEALVRLSGRQPTLFRFPAGSYTPAALSVVSRHGLRAIQWDVASGDPDPSLSTQAIVEQVLRQAQNGSIVVMHMNGASRRTAEALPAIIRRLREQGYTFVTVSQLLASEE